VLVKGNIIHLLHSGEGDMKIYSPIFILKTFKRNQYNYYEQFLLRSWLTSVDDTINNV
jgi:hypothetical protein